MDFDGVYILARQPDNDNSSDSTVHTTLTALRTSTIIVTRSSSTRSTTATGSGTTVSANGAPVGATVITSTSLFTGTSPSSSSSPSSSTPAAPPPPNGFPNLNLSNGTCYYAPGKPMDSRFIPCGNAAAQIQSCCWEGDNCLADNACFGIHDGGYNTYMAGCTDPDWNMSDPGAKAACPAKPAPYDTLPWFGLVYCGNNATGNRQWIACPQADTPASMVSAGPCACPTITQQRIVAFQDGPTLSSYASLPTSSGGSIMWFPPYSPTYAVPATQALGETATSSPTNSTTAALPPPSPSPKNTSLIIGISVGIGGFALLALLAAFVFIRNAKRKQRLAAQQMGETGYDGTGGLAGNGDRKSAMGGDEKMLGTSTSPTTQPSIAVSELEIRPARPWSMRSELDGAGVAAPTTNNLTTRNSIGTLLSSPPTSPPLGGGDLYESSTVSSLHGQLTGQTTGGATVGSVGSVGNRSNQHPGAPNFETLVELEG
ncbi:hypothetical protein Sste5346_008581 [Sporothrix stenoceras]|uniref:Uncharacterized protein n=1 Tax=Sporothrix stenoceras TaxID=5173 RepID=A0ABR3YQ54_9PEZI